MKPYVPNVASKLGTSTHKGVTLSLNEKKSGIITRVDDMYQAGIESFREEIHEGVVWDKSTNNINTAEKQIQQVLRAYYGIVLPTINPVGVELSLKAIINENYCLSGHLDVNCLESIHDFKNGARDPKASAQMGGYAVLRVANGLKKPDDLIIEHIPRTPLSKPQEMPVIIKYDVSAAMGEAKAIYKHIIMDTNDFLNSGNPACFLANNHSILCSEKWCSAYGTKFCLVGS